jgi:hypothetical protein
MAKQRRRRGHIQLRSNGTFRVHVYAGWDPITGERYRPKANADEVIHQPDCARGLWLAPSTVRQVQRSCAGRSTRAPGTELRLVTLPAAIRVLVVACALLAPALAAVAERATGLDRRL